MDVSRKQSKPNFPKNEHFLPPDTHRYVCVAGGRKCLFFGKFGMLCFLEISVLRFALLPYHRRIKSLKSNWAIHLKLQPLIPVHLIHFHLFDTYSRGAYGQDVAQMLNKILRKNLLLSELSQIYLFLMKKVKLSLS